MYPDITAENATHQKAKKQKAMAAAEESVNILSTVFLILSVIGIAEERDDIKRYATA